MGNWTPLVPPWNLRPCRGPNLGRSRLTWHFLVATFPCRAPCRDLRAFHFGVGCGRASTTSGSSCGEVDGNGASSRLGCWQLTPHREIALLLRVLYFQGPTWIAAVVRLPFR